MLYIFDLDGTLVMQGAHGSMAASSQTLLPGVGETCESLLEAGHILSIATNQGGVAYGYLTLEQAEERVKWVAGLIGAAFYELCPFHPQGIIPAYAKDAPCRKPNPGMLEALQGRTGVPWSEVVMVGNEYTDFQAAANAGVQFVWASEFF